MISKSHWDLHIFQHDSSFSLLFDPSLHASDVVKSGPDMEKKKVDEHGAGRTNTNHHDDHVQRHKHLLLKSRRPHTYSYISGILEEIDGVNHLQLRIDDTTSHVIDMTFFKNVEDLDDDFDQQRITMNECMILMTPSFRSDYCSEALR